MTLSGIARLCPQPVDRAWGRRCGPVRSVAPASTNRDGCSSTCGANPQGITRGYRCGRLGKTSYVRLTVDGRGGCPPLCTHDVHPLRPDLDCRNAGYPQVPQHRRRRRVISLKQQEQSSGCGSGDTPGLDPPNPAGSARAAWQDRIETFPQEASHEVPG